MTLMKPQSSETGLARYRGDAVAVAALVVLWLLFFWRLFTPVMADQASLKQGDFSDQFVTFGGYQYARLTQGEIPLWNPYNNGGLPFIADTQAAVFYPPRLITISLSSMAGGWTYHALELEMTAHMLFYTLALYALVRRMTQRSSGQVVGAFTAAVIGGYGGYLSGYPPLQLALLEAGVWLPLTILGIYEATQAKRLDFRWLVLTGAALGLSWMAGHPQTSFFLTYLLLAYLAYRVYVRRWSWTRFVMGALLFGIIAIGAVAVALLPGLEYLLRTSRSDLGFDAKGNGFPYQDFIQLLFPGIISEWSPLYVGLTGLSLAVIGIFARLRQTQETALPVGDIPADALVIVPEQTVTPTPFAEVNFWLAVALFGMALSVGANGAVFHAIYNVLPGMRFFRGQERAAFLFANSMAILAGFGMAALASGRMTLSSLRVRQSAAALFGACTAISVTIFAEWLARDRSGYDNLIGILTFCVLISGSLLIVLPEAAKNGRLTWLIALLVVFELFSINIDNGNYDSIPPQEQLQPNALLDIPLADADRPFRVDGLRVLGGNFGSLYALADIQGISPLFLTGPQTIIEDGLPDERAWELFAVRYVYSDWEALNVPGIVLADGQDSLGDVKLHQLTAPRPYAQLVYDYVKVDTDEESRLLLADPEFDPRSTAILHTEPDITLPDTSPTGAGTTITHYAPEALTVIVNTPENAILSLAQVDYPGWYATIDGEETAIVRAYGGLAAITVPAGDHTVELVYNPLTYRVGLILSAFTWVGLLIVCGFLIFRSLRKDYAN